MPRSMTAFDRREARGDWGKLVWELRSVNHRYLDLSPRLPEDLRQIESVVRERVSQRLGRGKVECTLKFSPAAGAAAAIELNWPYAEQLIGACKDLAERLPGAAPVSPVELLRVPGVVRESERDLEPIAQAAVDLLDQCLAGLVETREREGAKLAELIDSRAQRVAELAAELRPKLSEINAKVREKLLARLAEIEAPADNSRLEQELVFVAQRMDVDEELDRLVTHVEEIQRVLKRKEPIGRRLDFLMQELNREANTLGSKAAATEMTQTAVEMKVLIEQMREQIQNLE